MAKGKSVAIVLSEAEIEDMIQGKQLMIVPSTALLLLPFHVLVTRPPDVEAPHDYGKAAWLARSNPIMMLPAVSSLKALRENAKASAAANAYLGIGDPVRTLRPALTAGELAPAVMP